MEIFQKLSIAYDVLQNEYTRLEYDLFSYIYNEERFPQMDNIAVIKDRYGDENPFSRVIELQYVIGKIIKYDFRDEKIICTQKQAEHEVLKCSFLNWALGWWSIKAFGKNIKALIDNYANINNNPQDNLTLLIHNTVAFNKEGKKDKAYYSAKQALDYANEEQKKKINQYIEKIGYKKSKIPAWHNVKLRIYQLIIPFIIMLSALYPFIKNNSLYKYIGKENEVTYFQKVIFSSGAETIDDIVVSKIFAVPVDTGDINMLYHLIEDADVMYGPGKQFDILQKLTKNHTVRVTGFTPDKSWYRVMLDSGDMGFVKVKQISKGIGREVPEFSKIYVKR
jgi:hypothetical protein